MKYTEEKLHICDQTNNCCLENHKSCIHCNDVQIKPLLAYALQENTISFYSKCHAIVCLFVHLAISVSTPFVVYLCIFCWFINVFIYLFFQYFFPCINVPRTLIDT